MARKAKRGRPPGSGSAYRALAEKLTQRMFEGEWKADDNLPSMRQLATEYDVGLQVVRLALRTLHEEGKIRIDARHRAKVLGVGFTATATTLLKVLILGHNLNSHWGSPDNVEIQRGIERGVGMQTDPLLIAHHPKLLRSVIPSDLLELRLSGILLYGQFTPKVLKQYRNLSVPVVLVDQPGERWKISSVSVDNEQAAFDATTRLIQLGHRRIGFLRVVQLSLRDIDPDSKEREKGFRRAHQEAGLPPPKDAVFNSFQHDPPGTGPVAVLLKAKPRFTAVLAVDGGRAKLVAENAKELGLSIPKDISVACFQSTISKMKWSGPRINFETLGLAAVKALTHARKGDYNEKIPTEWFEGNSIAALK